MAAIVWWTALMPSLLHVAAIVVVMSAIAGCALAPPAHVTVVAQDIAFTPASMTLPAGTGFHLTFENRDDGVPHGLSLQTRTSGVPPTELWSSEIETGPSRSDFDVPSLPAGPYLLICPVHPNMQVEIDVG
jgi:plastocyanin